MTRKDYEMIASSVATAMRQWSGLTPERGDIENALSDLAHDLAGELKAANPNFQTHRFLKACGVKD